MSRRGRRGKGPGQGGQPGGRSHGQQQSGGQGQPHQKNRPHGQPKRHQGEASQSQESASDTRSFQADKAALVKGSQAFMSVMTPRRQIFKKQMHQRNSSPAVKTYGVVFFDTLQAAKADLEKLRETASQYDQLNIVVRAEASMDDPELGQIGKLFAGAAWTLIHERRKQDGWYDAKNE